MPPRALRCVCLGPAHLDCDDAGGEQHERCPLLEREAAAEEGEREERREQQLRLVQHLERHHLDVRQRDVDEVVLHCVQERWHGDTQGVAH